jgi:hypothetical protein
MRFFTRGWTQGDLTDEECKDVVRAYAAHVATLAPTLPESLRALASDVDLHDAAIERVDWDPAQRRLRIQIVTGSVRTGSPQSVVVTYIGTQLGERPIRTLQDVARDRETEILYHEVDRELDGGFVHRILFWPRDELNIWFDELILEVSDRSDGRVRLKPYFYEVIAEDDDD